jgi:hypothetical protein
MLGFDSSPFVIPLGILAWDRTSPGKNKRKSTLGITLGRTASQGLASLTRLSAIRWVAAVGNYRDGARGGPEASGFSAIGRIKHEDAQ